MNEHSQYANDVGSDMDIYLTSDDEENIDWAHELRGKDSNMAAQPKQGGENDHIMNKQREKQASDAPKPDEIILLGVKMKIKIQMWILKNALCQTPSTIVESLQQK